MSRIVITGRRMNSSEKFMARRYGPVDAACRLRLGVTSPPTDSGDWALESSWRPSVAVPVSVPIPMIATRVPGIETRLSVDHDAFAGGQAVRERPSDR